MNMATQEQQAEVGMDPAPGPDPDLEQAEITGFHEGAGEERVGWLMVIEGEQQVVPHPKGKTRQEVIQEFFRAKSKGVNAFHLGLGVYEPAEITTFVWSEDVEFPAMDKFDSLQDRIEALMEATAELTQNQATLQQAQALLFQDELDGMGEEEDEEPEPEPEPQRVRLTPKPGPGRKGFRPPGA